jgi:C4-dicarboxylate-specific signal transduction histidine kinase
MAAIDNENPARNPRPAVNPLRAWFPGAGLLAVAAVLLTLGAVLLTYNQNRLSEAFRWVDHTEQVLRQAANLDIALVDVESSSRAYILTANADYLSAYHDGRTAIADHLGQLDRLIGDNPEQRARLSEIRSLQQQRLDRIEKAIAADPAIRATLFSPDQVEAGQALRRSLRARLEQFRADEITLLADRQQTADRNAALSSGLAILTAVLGVAVAALGVFMLRRERSRSQIRELRSELHHLARVTTMGQTASMLAHEISQPLGAATNYLEALRRNLETAPTAPSEKAADCLQKAGIQVRRAAEIVGRLRRFVGKQESKRTVESVAALIEDSVSLLGTLSDATLLDTKVQPGLPAVELDRIQVQQVLVNLMRNAIEAMAASPRRMLMVAATKADVGGVEISVADTGPGLPEQIAANLFKPFVSTKAEGMGVGLSICRAIIQDHGGRIWTEANPGGGTVFRFTLPKGDSSRGDSLPSDSLPSDSRVN